MLYLTKTTVVTCVSAIRVKTQQRFVSVTTTYSSVCLSVAQCSVEWCSLFKHLIRYISCLFVVVSFQITAFLLLSQQAHGGAASCPPTGQFKLASSLSKTVLSPGRPRLSTDVPSSSSPELFTVSLHSVKLVCFFSPEDQMMEPQRRKPMKNEGNT